MIVDNELFKVMDLEVIWFQQSGITYHLSHDAKALLRKMLICHKDHVILAPWNIFCAIITVDYILPNHK